MSNRTELMKKILKSEQAQKIIDEISPVYGESYVCLWLFQIIGKELDKLDDFVQNLRDETVIQTADQWALKYWEEQYRGASSAGRKKKTKYYGKDKKELS